MKRRLVNILAGTVLGLALALVAAWQISRIEQRMAAEGQASTRVGTASIGGPFTLVDQNGRTVTDADFRGRYMLIYFGFTSCPDVCPTELQVMAQAVDALGGKAQAVRPMLITIDPERDTPEQLAGYVTMFHPDMAGLTGTPEQIAEAARAYRVYYAKAEQEGGDYTMDHSSFIYLMGPDGAFLDVYPGGTPPERIAESIEGHMAG
jgi:cytochrome oxidase Cu insertion factor (SCO1/SenC/PrrC family)